MSIFDSHCHLYWDADDDSISQQIAAANSQGVTKFMCVGTNAKTSRLSQAISKQYQQVAASVGIHPNDVGEIDSLQDKLSQINDLARANTWQAIGETGLDFFHKRTDVEAQLKSFGFHLDLANDLDLPVIIHCREAIKECVDFLESRNQQISGVMHCFSEGPDFVPRLLDIGLHFSFAGNVSYPKSDAIRESARIVPLDRLLVETDAPFLAPQAMRGKRNQSAFVTHTLEAVANARETQVSQIESQIYANTERLFAF